MRSDLEDRVIIVTGGTRGVGRELVARLSARGAKVLFQGQDATAAQELIDSCGDAKPTFVPGDLTDYASHQHLCQTAIDSYGRIDGAVGSGISRAAVGTTSIFSEADPSRFPEFFQHGFLPRAYLTHAAAQHMCAQGYGKVVLITTDAGRIPTPSEVMIGSAAAAVVYFTRAAAKELARSGVRVNTVSISLTKDTDSYARFSRKRAEAEGGVLEKMYDRIERRAPFGLSEPGEVADVACFLLGPETDGISGATLSLNRGGYFPIYA